jgi:hypothetical protein
VLEGTKRSSYAALLSMWWRRKACTNNGAGGGPVSSQIGGGGGGPLGVVGIVSKVEQWPPWSGFHDGEPHRWLWCRKQQQLEVEGNGSFVPSLGMK